MHTHSNSVSLSSTEQLKNLTVTSYFQFLFSGLLLPRVGVEHHGIERTDVGHLGSGIYFSDAVRFVENLKLTTPCSIQYSFIALKQSKPRTI